MWHVMTYDRVALGLARAPERQLELNLREHMDPLALPMPADAV